MTVQATLVPDARNLSVLCIDRCNLSLKFRIFCTSFPFLTPFLSLCQIWVCNPRHCKHHSQFPISPLSITLITSVFSKSLDYRKAEPETSYIGGGDGGGGGGGGGGAIKVVNFQISPVVVPESLTSSMRQ
jgi:hypothetical protein